MGSGDVSVPNVGPDASLRSNHMLSFRQYFPFHLPTNTTGLWLLWWAFCLLSGSGHARRCPGVLQWLSELQPVLYTLRASYTPTGNCWTTTLPENDYLRHFCIFTLGMPGVLPLLDQSRQLKLLWCEQALTVCHVCGGYSLCLGEPVINLFSLPRFELSSGSQGSFLLSELKLLYSCNPWYPRWLDTFWVFASFDAVSHKTAYLLFISHLCLSFM